MHSLNSDLDVPVPNLKRRSNDTAMHAEPDARKQALVNAGKLKLQEFKRKKEARKALSSTASNVQPAVPEERTGAQPITGQPGTDGAAVLGQTHGAEAAPPAANHVAGSISARTQAAVSAQDANADAPAEHASAISGSSRSGAVGKRMPNDTASRRPTPVPTDTMSPAGEVLPSGAHAAPKSPTKPDMQAQSRQLEQARLPAPSAQLAGSSAAVEPAAVVHQPGLEALQRKLDAAQSAQAAAERARQEEGARHAEELEVAKSSFAQQLHDVATELQQLKASHEAEHDDEVATLRAALIKARDEAAAAQARADGQDSHHSAQVVTLQGQLDESQEHAAQLAAERSADAEQHAAQTRALQDEVSELQERVESASKRQQQSTDEHAEEMQQLQDELAHVREQLAVSEDRAAAAVADLQTSGQSEMTEAAQRHAAELASLQEALNAAQQASTDAARHAETKLV